MKKILMRAGAISVAVLPFVASAQQVSDTYFRSIITAVNGLITALFPLVFAGAVLGFMIGIGMYLFSGGDEGKKEKAQDVMKYGLIVLFVMFAVYGIIRLAANVLGIGLGGSIPTPTLPTTGGGCAGGNC
ncbi:hypothetical protein K8Q93_02285 [Candidatus Parcubacteria bacterium]|nr:hypothetical protein [Candidatus Parcubacteria bacterium]